MEDGFSGPRPTPQQHPHLRLEQTMTSVPKVNPGDMVFWHCVCFPSSPCRDICQRRPQDVVHSVEQDHTGTGDSAGTLYVFFFGLWINANANAKLVCFSHVHRCGPADNHEYRIRQETGRNIPRRNQSS